MCQEPKQNAKSIFNNENNLIGIKKNNVLMKSINHQVCEYCMKPNYYSEKFCENCHNSFKTKSVNNKVNNNLKQNSSIDNKKHSVYCECLNCK